jgi:DNA repair protein RadC
MKANPTAGYLMRYSKAELVKLLLKETNEKLSKPDHLMDLISKYLRKYQFAEVEYFLAITIDAMGTPIKVHEISKGTMDHTIISPRDVFRAALLDNAASVIVLHNHPSGTIKPSEDDSMITKKLAQAGEIIGITLLDHILIGPNAQYFSYNESSSVELKEFGKGYDVVE